MKLVNVDTNAVRTTSRAMDFRYDDDRKLVYESAGSLKAVRVVREWPPAREQLPAAATSCTIATIGNTLGKSIPAAPARSTSKPPTTPPNAAPPATRPINCLAVYGSKRSLNTDQNPETRTDPITVV